MSLIPERVVERRIGCYSCKHWENGEPARLRFKLMTGLEPGVKLEVMAQRDVSNDPGLKQRVLDLRREGFNDKEIAAGLWATRYRQLQETYGMADKVGALVAAGQAGYCTVKAGGLGGEQADFTHHTNLCGDNSGTPCKWLGRDGASVAIAGEGMGTLFDEHTDLIDHQAKHRDVGSTATRAKPAELPIGSDKLPAPAEHNSFDPDLYRRDSGLVKP